VGGGWARGAARTTEQVGADAIFSLKENKLSFANYYKLPAARPYCELRATTAR